MHRRVPKLELGNECVLALGNGKKSTFCYFVLQIRRTMLYIISFHTRGV